MFNVILVGLISFTQPGIWNALNSKHDRSTVHENDIKESILIISHFRRGSRRATETLPGERSQCINIWVSQYPLKILSKRNGQELVLIC